MTPNHHPPFKADIAFAVKQYQKGATLIELMVGITIGLLTIAVAMGALMVSRGVSGTITDASQLQQQAAYAFRVLGQQLRQAGSIRLNLASNKNPGDTIDPADVVAFSPDSTITPLVGKDSPASNEFKLSIGYQNYSEPSYTSSSAVSLFRDCLGAQPSTSVIQSQFTIKDGELHCAGSNNTAQAIVRNVADFQVRYLVQTGALTGLPSIQSASAAGAATDWTRVFGVEVCLVLYGDETIDIPAGSTYTGCDGSSINMSSTGSLAANRKNHMHMTFRNVFQLRSQGRTG